MALMDKVSEFAKNASDKTAVMFETAKLNSKISAQETLTVNAMTIAPNTINGLRSNRRSARFSPFWIWLISSVRRVISVPVPRRSNSP